MINGEFHLTDKNQNITDENVLKIFRHLFGDKITGKQTFFQQYSQPHIRRSSKISVASSFSFFYPVVFPL